MQYARDQARHELSFGDQDAATHMVRVIKTEVLKHCAIPVFLTLPTKGLEVETKNCS